MVTQALPFHPYGALLIPGEEITGVGFHLAVVGIDRTIDWRAGGRRGGGGSCERGVVIAAHPAGALPPGSTTPPSPRSTAWKRRTR